MSHTPASSFMYTRPPEVSVVWATYGSESSPAKCVLSLHADSPQPNVSTLVTLQVSPAACEAGALTQSRLATSGSSKIQDLLSMFPPGNDRRGPRSGCGWVLRPISGQSDV